MGTRGHWVIVFNGKMYIAYNHFDSYPEKPGLGWTLINEIWWGNLKTWKEAIKHIKICEGTPTKDDKDALRKYTDLNVSSQSDNDWYCLTRKCQGSLVRTLQSGYFIGTVSTFNEEKLVKELNQAWSEWGYVVDLDKNEFRTFQGGEIHFWRFQLDDIPEGTFGEASILAFNRIADGDDFEYHQSDAATIDAYKRFFEEEKLKLKQEEEGKAANKKVCK